MNSIEMSFGLFYDKQGSVSIYEIEIAELITVIKSKILRALCVLCGWMALTKSHYT